MAASSNAAPTASFSPSTANTADLYERQLLEEELEATD